MKPFNTHEKREFCKLYVATYLGGCGAISPGQFEAASSRAESAWNHALEAGLIQDHDAETAGANDKKQEQKTGVETVEYSLDSIVPVTEVMTGVDVYIPEKLNPQKTYRLAHVIGGYCLRECEPVSEVKG